MRAAIIVSIISALSFTALAAPAPEQQSANPVPQGIPEAVLEEVLSSLPEKISEAMSRHNEGGDDEKDANQKRGWGCSIFGGNDQECHDHCKSIKGYKGGYCRAWICDCY